MTTKQNTTHYDAIIVGARCAGAATALLLARQGAKVLVVDHDQPGTDTMSTHALMRGAVFQLKKWGLLDTIIKAGTPAIRRTSFLYEDQVFDVDIKAEHGVDALYAPRRSLLDATIANAAIRAGAEFRYGTGCSGLVFDDDRRVRGVTLRAASRANEFVGADLVIGADGRRSAIARHVGAGINRQAHNSIACVYSYMSGLPNRGYRWHFAPGAAGGIIPTNDGLACVFVAVAPAVLARSRATGSAAQETLIQRHLPVLAQEIAGAVPVERPVTFPGALGYFRQSVGPGWALVGDAGYFRDPLTAHGITDALRDAELLAGAIMRGRLGEYPVLRDTMSSDFFGITDQIASLEWSMEAIQGHHRRLNKAMKANQDGIAELGASLQLAA
ncbi:NAD(P)/FAD-dependent oxidoreductase [Defluviimonas sp. WL0002]|uniref:NAD(P)/FAD-dependent oxidoreductase n=1 Tax=Albidovulum marisflavi TaxID=2984159 RepID=A0ABT2ZBH2_9RHOB|nr:NAD(P)/FAD-dependent oxidoreductase [Defluviimonas sp. WL0002]MCV2868449.1 NAD(P)/FAD-dependent oxidoreductase [Defluviimonas sp. WL0002]